MSLKCIIWLDATGVELVEKWDRYDLSDNGHFPRRNAFQNYVYTNTEVVVYVYYFSGNSFEAVFYSFTVASLLTAVHIDFKIKCVTKCTTLFLRCMLFVDHWALIKLNLN